MSYILLIEDNQENANMTIRILESARYQVKHCIRGFEGARIARSNPPDIILIDFDLPDIDGYTVALVLKKQLGHAAPPIIAVTARVGIAEIRLAEAYGCQAFISKPFLPEELLSVIERVLKTKSSGGR